MGPLASRCLRCVEPRHLLDVDRMSRLNTPPCGRGRRSLAQVAQLVEQGIENPRVGSSILSLGTKKQWIAEAPRRPRGVFAFKGRTFDRSCSILDSEQRLRTTCFASATEPAPRTLRVVHCTGSQGIRRSPLLVPNNHNTIRYGVLPLSMPLFQRQGGVHRFQDARSHGTDR